MISSPFERAVSTIRPLSKKLGLQIHIDERLSERVLSLDNLAHWMDQLKESFMNLDLKLPGGESSQEAMGRGSSVIKELWAREERNIVVVTHGNLMSLMLKNIDDRFGFDDWKALSNPDIYELSKSEKDDKLKIERLWKN